MQEIHNCHHWEYLSPTAEAGCNPMNAWPNREHPLKKLCDRLYVTSGTNSEDLTMKGYIIFFRERCD